MNKHDELIARVGMCEQNMMVIGGVETIPISRYLLRDFTDLLQFYGDALENMANGDVPRVTDTERHTGVLSLETYAQKTVEGE